MLHANPEIQQTMPGTLWDLSGWVPGLFVHEGFLEPATCASLYAYLTCRPWREDVCTPKRTQHYGNAYPELSADPDPDKQADVPPIIQSVLDRLRHYFGEDPNEIMVIEYRPGQGLGPHVDGSFWGAVIGSLSLGRQAVMRFSPQETPDQAIDVPLPEGSLLLMTGAARWSWYHAIPELPTHDPRVRVSLTLRTLDEEGAQKVQDMREIPGAAAGQAVGGYRGVT